MESFRSLRWVDYIYLTILEPRSMGRLINARGFLPVTFIIPVMVALSEIIALSRLSTQSGFFFYKITYGWIFVCIVLMLKLFAIAALIDLSAQFSGLKGAFPKTITLVTISLFPHLFLVPIVTIFTTISFAPVFFYFFATIAFSLWSVYIIIVGIAEFYEISFYRSCATVLIPCGAVFLVVLFLFVLFAALGYGALSYSHLLSM
ncbi:MAG TPA: YIP1 family protein [Spirochaetota bacterium]